MSTSTADTSSLSQAIQAPDVQITPGPMPQVPQAAPQQPTLAPQQGGSRLGQILSAVAKVATTGLASVPAQGRPSFVNGLTQGARGAQAAEAAQQDIKFKDFDNQLRLANLHNQDLQAQARTQEQNDAHQKFEDFQQDYDEAHGISYDTHPNQGEAVLQTLRGQTAANGAATIAPGTHVSADGESINIPSNDPNTQAGLLGKYKELAGVIPGIPAFPGMDKAQFVPAKNLDLMTHVLQGYAVDGSPLSHDQLNGLIPALQSQRAQLAKNGGSPYQLGTLDNLINVYQANEKNHSDAEDAAFAKQTKQAADRAGAIAGATAKAQAPYKEELQDNAAADKQQKGSGDTTELNSVAYDPNYQNPDGTKGANVVMSKGDAAAKGLQHYKADPDKINALVGGFNDVQNKINMLADVTTDPKRMSQVQGPTAAVLLKDGFGLEIGAFGTKVDLSNVNTAAYEAQLSHANQATRDYVTAMGAAHEAITQLPRLQTFGKSSRMTQQQMEAAQRMLPQPGDDAGMAQQKMTALQTAIDPLRKQVPHMPGAETMPSWLEKRQQQQAQQTQTNMGSGTSNLLQAISGMK